jgi:hypothetical protein
VHNGTFGLPQMAASGRVALQADFLGITCEFPFRGCLGRNATVAVCRGPLYRNLTLSKSYLFPYRKHFSINICLMLLSKLNRANPENHKKNINSRKVCRNMQSHESVITAL